jgi:anti-sigma B factor antagonist
MPLNVRVDGDIAILSNLGRLMNDPRYVDASKDVKELLDRGHRRFIIELGGVRDTGSTIIGLLMTLTRQIRQQGGEAVLANLGPDMEKLIEKMQMDDFWDVFEDVETAREDFLRGDAGRGP